MGLVLRKLGGVSVALCLSLLSTTALGQCPDLDGDGYGRPGSAACPQGPEEDCNDRHEGIFPGNPEVCDGFDNDCNGLLDDSANCVKALSAAQEVGDDIRFTDWAAVDQDPALVWDGSGYGAVYRGSNGWANFIRFSPVGEVLVDPVAVSPQEGWWQGHSDLVWTGSEYGVVWTDPRNEPDFRFEVYFARLDREGRKIGEDVRVTNATGDSGAFQDGLDIAWSGQEYGVVWLDDRPEATWESPEHAYYARVGADGRVSHETLLEVTTDPAKAVAIAWNGSEFGAGIVTEDELGLHSYWFVRIDPEGNYLMEPIVVGTELDSWINLLLTWNGEEYGYWWYPGPLRLVRINANGQIVEDHGIPFEYSWGKAFHSVSWNGGEYGLIWQYLLNLPGIVNNALRFSRISQTGEMLDIPVSPELQIGEDNPGQHRADTAWNGRGYGVIYTDRGPENSARYFTRVAQDFDGDTRFGVEDCDDTDSGLWAAPGPAINLHFEGDKESLRWDEPPDPGTHRTVRHDLLRSERAQDWADAVCVLSHATTPEARDPDAPLAGQAFFYLARASNDCGAGSLGAASEGGSRHAEICP